jgi:hypothetical protein
MLKEIRKTFECPLRLGQVIYETTFPFCPSEHLDLASCVDITLRREKKVDFSNCWCSEATQNDVPRATEILIDKQAVQLTTDVRT